MVSYNNYIVEKVLTDEKAEKILEKNIFSSYKDIQHMVLKEYGSQLYFVATFNSAIVSLYPVMKQIIYNSNFDITLSTYQIVLLTIFAIAEILHVNNDAVKSIRKKLEEDGISHLITGAKMSLLSVQKIFKVVTKTVGKTISLFIDMLAYVSILVPINDALIEVLQHDNGLNIESLPKKVLGLGIGLGILTFKNVVVNILTRLGFMKSPELEEKVEEIIKDDKKNIYHKMRTKERMK